MTASELRARLNALARRSFHMKTKTGAAMHLKAGDSVLIRAIVAEDFGDDVRIECADHRVRYSLCIDKRMIALPSPIGADVSRKD